MKDRRTFLRWLGGLPVLGRYLSPLPSPQTGRGGGAPPTVVATPTALYQQPEGRRNLVRIVVTGLDAPAGRARVTDRRGALVGSAGLLPAGPVLLGEVWVPLSEPSQFQIDVEVGKTRVARSRVRLVPPKRWTLYWLSTIHTAVGDTDLQERCLEIHRENLDAALARLPGHPDYRWTAECALQVISYVENRSPEAAGALVEAIRGGKIGFQALFANLLTGLLDHETLARVVWPAGLLARERGLGFAAAQLTDVPGQTLTFPTVLAASGVRYLATGPNPERAVPLLSAADGAAAGLAGDWPVYPQAYWWEGPDGGRVLHWRAYRYGDATRFGFDVGPDEMGRRLSDWLLTNPVFLSPGYPFDIALLYGASASDNAPIDERLVQNMEEFNRRFAFPRIVPGRAEDFFRDLERRWGAKLPVRRGDTGCYWEDGAASTAAELARFRRAQLAARAAELVALWDDRLEPRDDEATARLARRASERQAMWRDLLLFGEHTWGADVSVSAPDSRQTVAQWLYKRRLLDGAAAAAERQLAEGLLRIGGATQAGAGRLVFNASSWPRSEVAHVPDGAGQRLAYAGAELPAVDFPDGSALVLMRDVPALGYLALAESERPPRPVVDDGAALDAQAGAFHLALDSATGAVRSLVGGGKERVNPAAWSGLNQLVYVRGGARSALWTDRSRDYLKAPPELAVAQAQLVAARRERLPGIGVRLVATRRLEGFPSLTSTVTLYDELPWIDVENRLAKTPTLEKEALYVAFPFALTKPVVEVEVPLGRMAVERDQQPASCRDWFCHAHWVWLHDASDGILWSGPDTPLFTLNDVCRGAWRRRIEPDGTLFAYAMNNYWHTNYAARQGGEHVFRFRVSLLSPGAEPAEPVRRGWAACDPLYVSAPYTAAVPGPLTAKAAALSLPDPGVLVVGAKPADDGEGVVVKLLDVAGAARSVTIRPAAYTFRAARRANLVEMNGDTLAVTQDGYVALDLPAWGVGAARLFTPREGSG